MVKKLSLSLILFISGCGFYPIDSGFIDPVFEPYVEEYKNDKFLYLNTKSIKKVSIVFKTLDEYTSGMCEMTGFISKFDNRHKIVYRHIFINPNIWYIMSNVDKKLLIYHELGHCDLDLDHAEGESIMNAYSLMDSVFLTNPSYFLDLLFYEGK